MKSISLNEDRQHDYGHEVTDRGSKRLLRDTMRIALSTMEKFSQNDYDNIF